MAKHYNVGSRNAGAKLCVEDIEAIRKLRVEQNLNLAELARQFGISESHAWRIAASQKWPSVDNPYLLLPKRRDRFKPLRSKVSDPTVKPGNPNLANHRISFTVLNSD